MKRLILGLVLILAATAIQAQGFQPAGHVAFGDVTAESLSTFAFAADTMTITTAEGVIAFGFKANANNSNNVFMEGVKETVSGIESDQIPFAAGEVFNHGLLIAVSDSVTIFSNYATDTCIVTIIKR